jgi:hypothetical protein
MELISLLLRRCDSSKGGRHISGLEFEILIVDHSRGSKGGLWEAL